MQSFVLVLEASTPESSVALLTDGEIVAHALVASHDPVTGKRSEGLLPAIADCLAHAEMTPKQLTAIVCSGGPGGFTSLRSAAAIAKGMCTASQIPLYAVPTMELLVSTAQLPSGWYVAALDAGREEWYASTVRVVDDRPAEVGPIIIVSAERLHTLVREMHAQMIGPRREIDIVPRASAAGPLLQTILARGPVDPERWEPAYGRLAEAQIKWESAHGRPLAS